MTNPRSKTAKVKKATKVAKKIHERQLAPKRDPRGVNPATNLPHNRGKR